MEIYLLTSDGDIYYLLSNIYNNGIENDINNFKKINTKYKYNELKEWYFNTSPVGNVIALVGITSDEKQMLISTGMGVLYNEIEFKQDDVKANINSCVVSKSDYLYKTYEDFSNDKKIQNSKINKVFKE